MTTPLIPPPGTPGPPTPEEAAEAFAAALLDHADWRREEFPERAARLDATASLARSIRGRGLLRLGYFRWGGDYQQPATVQLRFNFPAFGLVLDYAAEEYTEPEQILTAICEMVSGATKLMHAGFIVTDPCSLANDPRLG
jgi:hypothetical protein